jgi:putative membrane protein
MRRRFKGGAFLASAALFIALMGSAAAQKAGSAANSNGTPKMGDMRFAQAAAIINMEEVELGNLAPRVGYDYKVKEFGKRMVTDHSKLEDELTAIAARDRLTLPSAPDTQAKAAVAKLSSMSGPKFDQAYLQAMIKGHEEAIAEFQDEASNGMNTDLKNWAAASVPILKDHLQMAKNDEIAIDAAEADGIITRK